MLLIWDGNLRICLCWATPFEQLIWSIFQNGNVRKLHWQLLGSQGLPSLPRAPQVFLDAMQWHLGFIGVFFSVFFFFFFLFFSLNVSWAWSLFPVKVWECVRLLIWGCNPKIGLYWASLLEK